LAQERQGAKSFLGSFCARIARVDNGSVSGLVPAVSSVGTGMTDVPGDSAGNLAD